LSSEPRRGQQRRDSWFELVPLLSVHETAEEELVHPLARASIDSGDAVVDARLTGRQADAVGAV
jgi:hypothetical protein